MGVSPQQSQSQFHPSIVKDEPPSDTDMALVAHPPSSHFANPAYAHALSHHQTSTMASSPSEQMVPPIAVLPGSNGNGNGVAASSPSPTSATGAKRTPYRPAPAKTFQCRGFGECRMVFSRSEHLARHIRKHTGERPFTCHCSKQFSRLDNLRQHAQTVHADKAEENEQMMRDLTSLHATMVASNKTTRRRAPASGNHGTSQSVNIPKPNGSASSKLRPGTSTGYEATPGSHFNPSAPGPSPTSPNPYAPHSPYTESPISPTSAFPPPQSATSTTSSSGFSQSHLRHDASPSALPDSFLASQQQQQSPITNNANSNNANNNDASRSASHKSFLASQQPIQHQQQPSTESFRDSFRSSQPTQQQHGHESFRALPGSGQPFPGDSPNITNREQRPFRSFRPSTSTGVESSAPFRVVFGSDGGSSPPHAPAVADISPSAAAARRFRAEYASEEGTDSAATAERPSTGTAGVSSSDTFRFSVPELPSDIANAGPLQKISNERDVPLSSASGASRPSTHAGEQRRLPSISALFPSGSLPSSTSTSDAPQSMDTSSASRPGTAQRFAFSVHSNAGAADGTSSSAGTSRPATRDGPVGFTDERVLPLPVPTAAGNRPGTASGEVPSTVGAAAWDGWDVRPGTAPSVGTFGGSIGAFGGGLGTRHGLGSFALSSSSVVSAGSGAGSGNNVGRGRELDGREHASSRDDRHSVFVRGDGSADADADEAEGAQRSRVGGFGRGDGNGRDGNGGVRDGYGDGFGGGSGYAGDGRDGRDAKDTGGGRGGGWGGYGGGGVSGVAWDGQSQSGAASPATAGSTGGGGGVGQWRRDEDGDVAMDEYDGESPFSFNVGTAAAEGTSSGNPRKRTFAESYAGTDDGDGDAVRPPTANERRPSFEYAERPATGSSQRPSSKRLSLMELCASREQPNSPGASEWQQRRRASNASPPAFAVAAGDSRPTTSSGFGFSYLTLGSAGESTGKKSGSFAAFSSPQDGGGERGGVQARAASTAAVAALPRAGTGAGFVGGDVGAASATGPGSATAVVHGWRPSASSASASASLSPTSAATDGSSGGGYFPAAGGATAGTSANAFSAAYAARGHRAQSSVSSTDSSGQSELGGGRGAAAGVRAGPGTVLSLSPSPSASPRSERSSPGLGGKRGVSSSPRVALRG